MRLGGLHDSSMMGDVMERLRDDGGGGMGDVMKGLRDDGGGVGVGVVVG